MIKANAQGYFPYTPAAILLRGLRAAVDMLLEEGLEKSSPAIIGWRAASVRLWKHGVYAYAHRVPNGTPTP